MEDFLSVCTSGGCGAKIGAADLADFLKLLPKNEDNNLLIGFDASDDAAVYQVSEDTAIINTVDFFSPMVDDPYIFGQIAAANALSDVYAMGGTPILALNLVCFPERLPKSALSEMLRGGAEKVKESGAVLAGGHSIYDHEPKYGLSVTGKVASNAFIQNNTPQTGDVLILTKALGCGLVLSAQRGRCGDAAATDTAIKGMVRLNKYAAEKMAGYSVHACTDVTGFGLLGHALEMAGDKHTLMIETDALPVLPKAYDFASDFLFTAGGQRNRQHIGEQVDVSQLDLAMQEILFDPQTSGGLLISVEATSAAKLLEEIQIEDPAAAIIGMVDTRQDKAIILF